MINCHLASYMTRDRLTVSDVSRLTGLNRSTVSALSRQTATRIELPAIERLCRLFRCSIGEMFELGPQDEGAAA
eukprot:gene18426-23541_t